MKIEVGFLKRCDVNLAYYDRHGSSIGALKIRPRVLFNQASRRQKEWA